MKNNKYFACFVKKKYTKRDLVPIFIHVLFLYWCTLFFKTRLDDNENDNFRAKLSFLLWLQFSDGLLCSLVALLFHTTQSKIYMMMICRIKYYPSLKREPIQSD
jgi:hypothetical protein